MKRTIYIVLEMTIHCMGTVQIDRMQSIL